MVFVAIRVRGKVNVNPDIKHTLNLLNLTRANHCVILEEKPNIKGMLQVVKDYVTWGEVDKELVTKMIKTRGKLRGDKSITDAFVKKSTSYKDIEKLSQAIVDNKFRYKELPEVKPVFRLNPPTKGFRSVKRSFTKSGGALGYRGKDINKLLDRMI